MNSREQLIRLYYEAFYAGAIFHEVRIGTLEPTARRVSIFLPYINEVLYAVE